MELDKFIENITRIDKSFIKDNQKLILELFEPIVYQMVLFTRMDTGRARKELGEKFAKKVGSQRIIDAIDMDIEVGEKVYNHFNDETRAMINRSTFRTLVAQKKVSIEILSNDIGLAEQEQGVDRGYPSKNHPRPLRARHITRHLTKVADRFNIDDLENFNSPYFYKTIAEDLQKSVVEIIRKIEREMFS